MWKSELIVVVIALAQSILIHPSGKGYYEEVRPGNFHICATIFQSTKSTLHQHHFSVVSKKLHNTPPLLYLFAIVLLNANDCHPNPGPRTPKFPCQICGKACKWSKVVHSIACNNCELWFHRQCLNMNTFVYEALEKTDVSWYCCQCGLPNFNTSLFDDIEIGNSDGTCSTPSHLSHVSVNSDFDPDTVGPPQHTSSPSAPHRPRKREVESKKLRVIVANLQSIKAKRESLWSMLSDIDPDIVIATETWLHPGITEKEVLPDNYQFLARKDRPNDPHGGVAVIAKSEIAGVQVDTDTDTELTAAAITCKHSKDPLIVGSLYRPPSSKAEYTEGFARRSGTCPRNTQGQLSGSAVMQICLTSVGRHLVRPLLATPYRSTQPSLTPFST